MLAAHPGNSNYQRSVGLDHKYLCSVFMGPSETHDSKIAAYHARLAVESDRKRVQANPGDADAKTDLAFSLSQAGTAYVQQRDLASAMSSLEETIEVRRALLDADPRNFRVQKMDLPSARAR